MSPSNLTLHIVDGHAYAIDEHRIIREPGRFKDQPAYAPYFWNAYLDGTYDDERSECDGYVIVFTITDDDRYDYPELTGATTLYMWETPEGTLKTKLDRLE